MDGKNYITYEDLERAFARCSRKLPDIELKKMINEVDTSNLGHINYA